MRKLALAPILLLCLAATPALSLSGKPYITATDVDFSALITKLKTENPDVVYYGGTMPGVGLFLKQLRDLGVKSMFFAADPAFLPDLITTAGPAPTSTGTRKVRTGRT